MAMNIKSMNFTDIRTNKCKYPLHHKTLSSLYTSLQGQAETMKFQPPLVKEQF